MRVAETTAGVERSCRVPGEVVSAAWSQRRGRIVKGRM